MNTDTVALLMKSCFRNADKFQAIVLTIGTIVAGYWTYIGFIRQRTKYPKITTTLDMSCIKMQPNHLLLRVEIIIENIGEILFKSNYAELRLRRIKPVPEDIVDNYSKGYDPVNADSTQIEWPCVANREWKRSFEIEPKEKDSLHADFFIKDSVETIELYFFLQNIKKKKYMGWTLTKIFNLTKED